MARTRELPETKQKTFNLDRRISDFLDRMGENFNASKWANNILLREVELSQIEQKVKRAQELEMEMQEKAKEKELLLEEVGKKMDEKTTELKEKEKKALESAEFKVIYAKILDYRKQDMEIVNQAYRDLREQGVMQGERNIFQLEKWKELIEKRLPQRPESR